MNLKRLELLVNAEYDNQRLDRAKVIEKLSDSGYQRFCRHSSFTSQAIVERNPSYRHGTGNTIWFYEYWNRFPEIDLSEPV